MSSSSSEESGTNGGYMWWGASWTLESDPAFVSSTAIAEEVLGSQVFQSTKICRQKSVLSGGSFLPEALAYQETARGTQKQRPN